MATPPEWFKFEFCATSDEADAFDWERFDDALAMFFAVLAPNTPADAIQVDGKRAARLTRA